MVEKKGAGHSLVQFIGKLQVQVVTSSGEQLRPTEESASSDKDHSNSTTLLHSENVVNALTLSLIQLSHIASKLEKKAPKPDQSGQPRMAPSPSLPQPGSRQQLLKHPTCCRNHDIFGITPTKLTT